jgi:hypothetical protein
MFFLSDSALRSVQTSQKHAEFAAAARLDPQYAEAVPHCGT